MISYDSILVFKPDGSFEVMDDFPSGPVSTEIFVYRNNRNAWYVKLHKLAAFWTPINESSVPEHILKICKTLKLLNW